jgi:hypothetical protein
LTAENNNLENDEPEFEPPKLEDSTAPVSSTPKNALTAQTLIPKAISFDSFVDQKTAASLRKKSMPASMLASSMDERFEVMLI